MKIFVTVYLFIGLLSLFVGKAYSQYTKFNIHTDLKTGGIHKIMNLDDKHNMNWIFVSDGSDLSWQTEEYAWGLGYVTIAYGEKRETYQWKNVSDIFSSEEGTVYTYIFPNFKLCIVRSFDSKGDFVEDYIFENISSSIIKLSDIGIYTPFKDWYWGGAEICLTSRCNAHVWTGMNSSYINAIRMGGVAPHLGLVLIDGRIDNYEIINIEEDSEWKGWSNTRGGITLRPVVGILKPGEKTHIKWKLFWHEGRDDFYTKAIQSGFVKAEADKYFLPVGEPVNIRFTSHEKLDVVSCDVNGESVDCQQSEKEITLSYTSGTPGDKVVRLTYDGKQTNLNLYYSIPTVDLVDKRIDFIIQNQQIIDKSDPRYGAYMVYDNETKSIYKDHISDLPSRADKNEGAERLGMGNAIALWLQQQPSVDKNAEKSILNYYDFVRNKLQTLDYKVYSNVDKSSKPRGYNYPFVATLYLELYRYFKKPQYMKDCYYTLRKLYKEFGYDFYAICVPVKNSIEFLKEAGLKAEADTLFNDYLLVAEEYLKHGIHYPSHEVAYEQGIVSPTVIFYLEMYLLTKENKYLEEAKKHMVLLEAFNGQQPDYHLNEIAIRHWDGYWFGKRTSWGDVMPHYWSVLTGKAFLLYYMATGEDQYLKRGKIILENNLCNIRNDGTASCAYIYPERINGKSGKFFDPFANDQDWALYYYLEMKDIIGGEK